MGVTERTRRHCATSWNNCHVGSEGQKRLPDNPLYDPIGPGETAVESTYIRIMRGSVTDFQRAAGLPSTP